MIWPINVSPIYITVPSRIPKTLSNKNPPMKQRMTFGQEYMEYSKTNVLVDICKSVLKLSCNAPGLSKQKYEPEMKDLYQLKYLLEHNLVKKHIFKKKFTQTFLHMHNSIMCQILISFT